MRRFRRAPVASCKDRQRNASEIGGAVGARRKLLIYRFLFPQIRPIPARLGPDESGCRIASGCLIIGRGVSPSNAADFRRRSGRCSGAVGQAFQPDIPRQACDAAAAGVRATWNGLSAQCLPFGVINSVSLTTDNRQRRTGGNPAVTGRSMKETGCAVSLFCLFSLYIRCADFPISLKRAPRLVYKI
jgi:hypothetical protein